MPRGLGGFDIAVERFLWRPFEPSRGRESHRRCRGQSATPLWPGHWTQTRSTLWLGISAGDIVIAVDQFRLQRRQRGSSTTLRWAVFGCNPAGEWTNIFLKRAPCPSRPCRQTATGLNTGLPACGVYSDGFIPVSEQIQSLLVGISRLRCADEPTARSPRRQRYARRAESAKRHPENSVVRRDIPSSASVGAKAGDIKVFPYIEQRTSRTVRDHATAIAGPARRRREPASLRAATCCSRLIPIVIIPPCRFTTTGQ